MVGIPCVLQKLACANVFQGKSLAFDIVDGPYGTVLEVLAVAFGQSEDETAPACRQRLGIQIAWLAPDVVLLIIGGDEPADCAYGQKRGG